MMLNILGKEEVINIKKIIILLVGIILVISILSYVVADINHGEGLSRDDGKNVSVANVNMLRHF